MSRSAVLLIVLVAVVAAIFVGLIVLSGSVQPPERQVEQAIPDERLPK